jgi:hypothetical protein
LPEAHRFEGVDAVHVRQRAADGPVGRHQLPWNRLGRSVIVANWKAANDEERTKRSSSKYLKDSTAYEDNRWE